MGLKDRDYYREISSAGASGLRAYSMVIWLIAINAAVWVVQVIGAPLGYDLSVILGCSPTDLFTRGWVWQLLTANFLHAPGNPGHILGNMLFLFFFGRDLEAIYGKRDFLIFYLLAGGIAMLAEAAVDFFWASPQTVIIGASGSVAGVVVLFTFFFPKRELYLGLLIPIQAWLLCLIFIVLNVSGAISMGGRMSGETAHVAYWAHIGGMLAGVLYRYVDLRWETVRSHYLGALRRRLPRRGARPRVVGRILRDGAVETPARGAQPPARDSVSERIDRLLEKIHHEGKESLSAEEWEFLKANSGKYRSD